MEPFLAFVKSHLALVAVILGLWSAIATALNKTKWPRPASGSAWWKLLLHGILIDAPAFLPSVDMKGIFGAPFNVPFITLSNHPAPTPETLDVGEAIASITRRQPITRQGGFVRLAPMMLLLIAGAAFLAAVGCVSTADFVNGGRKTLNIAAQAQADGIGAFVKYDAIHQEAIAAKDEPVDARKAELATYRATRAKVMDGVDALASATSAASKQLDAIEAGAAKSADFLPYLAAVISAGTALHDILAALGIDLPVLDNLLDKPAPPLPTPPASSRISATVVS